MGDSGLDTQWKLGEVYTLGCDYIHRHLLYPMSTN